MAYNIKDAAIGTFGHFLADYIEEHDGQIKIAADKIGLHPFVVSHHMRLMKRPNYGSIILYSKYLGIRPGEIADMIDNDWRSIKNGRD